MIIWIGPAISMTGAALSVLAAATEKSWLSRLGVVLTSVGAGFWAGCTITMLTMLAK